MVSVDFENGCNLWWDNKLALKGINNITSVYTAMLDFYILCWVTDDV